MGNMSEKSASPEPAVKIQDEQKPAAPPAGAGTTPQGAAPEQPRPPEIGGPKGPEPTRYGDWERKGRVSDF